MAVDYAEKEREFLESLLQDTGRDLNGWMAAIAETRLTDRNAIIDWLRSQGFLFARASWLERIYHNGGRPIYLDERQIGSRAPPADRRGTAPIPVAASPPPPVLAKLEPRRPAPEPARPVPPVPDPPVQSWRGLEDVLAEAKGYRPLALLVLRAIEAAAPAAAFTARDGYIEIAGAGGLAGVLALAARELRLAIAWPGSEAPAGFVKAKFAKTHATIPAEITHMVILTDARQVTPDLIDAVKHALRLA